MKRCPYCGKEYSDDAVQCFTDGYALTEIGEQAPSGKEQVNIVGGPDDSAGGISELQPEYKEQPGLTSPDYRWSARDGWKCLGMLLVFGFVLSAGVSAIDTLFRPSQSLKACADTWRQLRKQLIDFRLFRSI